MDLCEVPGQPRSTLGRHVAAQREEHSDLVLYMAIGVVVGGRLGDVLFYEPSYFIQHPLEIAQLWNGGMAFHGGLIGAFLAIWYFARETKVPILTVADISAAAAPIGIFLVRIANFIKPELWGAADRRAVGNDISGRR
jgi:phosphatidylglycerol---prolipoprotein diacylglyceryl transferase